MAEVQFYPRRLFSLGGAGIGLLLTLSALIAWFRMGHASAEFTYPTVPRPSGPASLGCITIGLAGLAVTAISLFLSGRRRAVLLVVLAVPAMIPFSFLRHWAGVDGSFGYSVSQALLWLVMALAWIFNRRPMRQSRAGYLMLIRFTLVGLACWAGLLELRYVVAQLGWMSVSALWDAGAAAIATILTFVLGLLLLPTLAVVLALSHIGTGRFKLYRTIDIVALLPAAWWLFITWLWLTHSGAATLQRAALLAVAACCGGLWLALGLYEWLLVHLRNHTAPVVPTNAPPPTPTPCLARPANGRYIQIGSAVLAATLVGCAVGAKLWLRHLEADSGLDQSSIALRNFILFGYVCIGLAATAVAVSLHGRRRYLPVIILALAGLLLNSWGLYQSIDLTWTMQHLLVLARVLMPMSLVWLFNHTGEAELTLDRSAIWPIASAGALLAVALSIFTDGIADAGRIPPRLADASTVRVALQTTGPLVHGFFGALAAVLFLLYHGGLIRRNVRATIDTMLYISLAGLVLYNIGRSHVLTVSGVQTAALHWAGIICWLLVTVALWEMWGREMSPTPAAPSARKESAQLNAEGY